MDLVYLAGAPGAGKSTLMAELTACCERHPQKGPPPHDALIRDGDILGCEIGKHRAAFPGTDALSMSVQPVTLDWMRRFYYRTVLGEGQRLGNRKFLDAAASMAYFVTLVYLDADEDLLRQRRSARGSAQDYGWVKGAATQAANLFAWAEQQTRITAVSFDAAVPPAELAAQLTSTIPALKGFK